MSLSAVPVEKKASKLARFKKTAFSAVVALMMLMGGPGASNAEMRKSTGSAGGGFHKPAPSQTHAPKSATAMNGVASPSVADTKSTPSAPAKPAPTKNVATTIKEGADGSKTKVTTTTTTDADGKKHVTSEKTIIRQGNGAAAAPAAGAAAAAAPAKEIHVIHGGGMGAPMSGSGMVAAAAGAAVGAAAMSALAPPAPWYNPMGWGMPGMGMMGQPMMAPMATPFGVAVGFKTALLTSLVLGLGITVLLIFLFKR